MNAFDLCTTDTAFGICFTRQKNLILILHNEAHSHIHIAAVIKISNEQKNKYGYIKTELIELFHLI